MDKKLPGSLQGRTNIARCLHTWIPFWHTELNCLSKIAPQFFLHYSFLVFSMRTIFFFFFLTGSNFSFPGILNKKAFKKEEPVQTGREVGWQVEADPQGWVKLPLRGWRLGLIPRAAPWQGQGLVLTARRAAHLSSPALWPHLSKLLSSFINIHTLSWAEEFLPHHSSEDPTFQAPKIFSLLLWLGECSVLFTKQWLTLPSKFWNTGEHFHPLRSVYYWEKAFKGWRRHNISLIYNVVRNTAIKLFISSRVGCSFFIVNYQIMKETVLGKYFFFHKA